MTGLIVLFWLGLFWGLPIYVGHRIGSKKGRAGWAWGLFLGWIGVIIVACLGPSAKGLLEMQRQMHYQSAAYGGPPALVPGQTIAPPTPPTYPASPTYVQQPALAAPIPPAGWYNDPSNPANIRFWDGGTWTENVAPATALTQPHAPAQRRVTGTADRPSVAQERLDEADAHVAAGEYARVFAPLNDELYEASLRGDIDSLQQLLAIVTRIEAASDADTRAKSEASKKAGEIREQLARFPATPATETPPRQPFPAATQP